MSYPEHHRAARRGLRVALLTASDSRTIAEDESGDVLERLCSADGHTVVGRRVVKDDPARIRSAARALLRGADALLVTGGTGPGPRDVTPEALRPWFVKEFPGFGERFRALSVPEVGSGAYLSRATLGLVRQGRRLVPVYLLPGSPDACRLAAEKLVLPELGHLVGVIAGGRAHA